MKAEGRERTLLFLSLND